GGTRIMICYTDQADKRRRYPAETIPALFAAAAATPVFTVADWLGPVAMMDRGPAQLRAVHDLARRGAYRASQPMQCDPLQSARDTILHGGDCDQWAVVIYAALKFLGYR